MPLYAYQCPRCGPFDAYRPMAEYRAPCPCPACGVSSARKVTAPQLNIMPAAIRNAHAKNERSAHAPKVRHASCCAGGTCARHRAGNGNGAAPKEGRAPALKMQAGARRPWQISH